MELEFLLLCKDDCTFSFLKILVLLSSDDKGIGDRANDSIRGFLVDLISIKGSNSFSDKLFL